MKSDQLFATVPLLLLALTTGCSAMHGDPKNPTKNPHPVRQYEVVATADAPGSWDSVQGYLSFDIANVECVPKDSFTGGQNVPNIDFNFEMERVENHTWKGYFYGDALQDEDYFGLGVCHWTAATVASQFMAHGESFTPGDRLEVLLHKSPQTVYFKKRDFLNHSKIDGGFGTTPEDPEIAKDPKAFFPITVTVKEAMP